MPFCGDTELFCGDTVLFCGDTELFCADTGLFGGRYGALLPNRVLDIEGVYESKKSMSTKP